jgi:hypothetical protein
MNLCLSAAIVAVPSSEVTAHITPPGSSVRTACNDAKFGLGVEFHVLAVKGRCVSFVSNAMEGGW